MATSMIPTFEAALRAVGTASTMAFAGFYLHRRNFVTPSGKKMLALLSQQVTIPAFLFAKIIYCPSGSGEGGESSGGSSLDPTTIDSGMPEIVCPSVASRIGDLWMLLLWPGFVVLSGLLTGYIAARVSKTPTSQITCCMAACAFPNSTGLPITLLSVIHKQMRKGTELSRVDPTAFLSVYLLFYPVLQWGMGGWLLAPEEKKDDNDVMEKGISTIEQGGDPKEAGVISEASSLLATANNNGTDSTINNLHARYHYHISHLLNREELHQSPSFVAGQEEFGGVRSRHFLMRSKENSNDGRAHLYSTEDNESNLALSMMVEELSFTNLSQVGSSQTFSRRQSLSNNKPSYLLPHAESEIPDGPLIIDDGNNDSAPSLNAIVASATDTPTIHEDVRVTNNGHISSAATCGANGNSISTPRIPSQQQIQTLRGKDVLPLTETLIRISRKVFQPPVIGALLGLFIASFPGLRGQFENIYGDERKTAPLKWMFDGIYSVGTAAVPINMTILGINLSSTFQKKKKKDSDESDAEKNKVLSNDTMFAVVFGKMFVMPIIGIVATWFLQRYYIDFPDEIDATCYLVMMIVFITPTANNVMVMVELSGSGSKEGMARLIGYQYATAPVILSIVLAVVVSLASCHFNDTPMC